MRKIRSKKSDHNEAPLIGIFWVYREIKEIVLIHADPVQSIEREPGDEFINGPHAHFAVWELLKAKGGLPEKWREMEYEYVPRGRVLYDCKKKIFKVFASKKLCNLKWFQREVLKGFRLPGDKTRFFDDPHYEIPAGKLRGEKVADPKAKALNGKMTLDDGDSRPAVSNLLKNLKAAMPVLEKYLEECSDHWGYEDRIYHFYHQSFKVYHLQRKTAEIVTRLQALLPDTPLNDWFLEIVQDGTGKTFKSEDNENWLPVTRPIIEAFFHARFFLEMAVKYGKELDLPPRMLPSGWGHSCICSIYDTDTMMTSKEFSRVRVTVFLKIRKNFAEF